MYKLSFKKSVLAASIAAVVAVGAHAQDEAIAEEAIIDEQEASDEIVLVTGIRASMQRSMDLKRDAKGIVDGISAEDIGKFPDTNLAESLQRISGIAIDRSRGEGSEITVRGFGPEFNIVTFNSRQMPTTGGRSFDFANIASEGISAVEVYKSGRANVATGGIGAVVNVKTAKPLENPGFKAVVSAKGVHDPGTRTGSNVSPELSGLFSNTFADDRVGVSLSLSYQERDGGTQSATTQNFMSRNFVTQEQIDNNHPDAESGSIAVGDPSAINFPTEVNDGIYAIPTNVQYNLDDFHRERINGQLTLQFAPIDSITATLDYTYAENQIDTQHQDLSAWFDPGCRTRESEWVKDGNIYSPTTFVHEGCGQDNLQGVGLFAQVDENKSLGANIEWRPTDQLTFMLDYHDSSGESRPNSKNGTSGSVAVAGFNRITSSAYFSEDGMPILEVALGERNSHNQITRIDELDVNDMQLSGSGFGNFENRMDVEQAQFDADYQFDNGHSINFGISTVEVTNHGRATGVQRNNWSGVGEPGDVADLLTIESITGVFDNLQGSGDPRQVTEFYTWDFDAMIERGEDLLRAGEHGNIQPENAGPCLTGFCPSYDFSVDDIVTETSNSAYLQAHIVGDFGPMPYNFFAGVRYEETKVHSEALVPLYDRVEWSVIDNNLSLEELLDDEGDVIQGFSEIDGEYDIFLPSVDFDIKIVDDVILRTSYSKTITRPTYGDLRGALLIGGLTADGGSGSRGNPQLKPMESTNFDFSAEWYYDEASYVSVGYWTKDVVNFIQSVTFEDLPLFDNLHTPIDGPLYDEAIEAITGGDPLFEYDDEDVNAYFAENLADAPGVEVTGEDDDIEVVVTGQNVDPVATFDVTLPVNQRDTKVKGWEFMAQHTFGESGFGFQANYTIVKGDLNYDINLNEGQWVVPGMSDTANFIAFYDKDGLQVRIAYNWRDQFLQDPGRDPRFVEEYAQWDMNISYDINDNLSTFVEAINLTEENYRIHGRSKHQVRSYEVGHARYNFGLRYVF